MKNQFLKPHTSLILIISCFSLFSLMAHADEKGASLAQRVYDRPDGTSLVTKTTMILKSAGAQTRQREFYSYRKDFPDGTIKSLIRFTLPADVENTGLMTHDHKTGESDQWLYLPALANIRRISSDRKGGRFVGSDLFYEDLQDRKPDQDNHTYLGQEEWNEAQCDVLESVPVTESNSSYSKRVAWIHPETLIPIRIDYYQNNQSTPMKRLEVKKIEAIQGFWTVTEAEISDLKRDHKTIIISDKTNYDTDLPDNLFTQAVLEDSAYESPYRP